MEKFLLVYIDDKPEPGLARYLDQVFYSENYNIEYAEITFDPQKGYEDLLKDDKVKSANIVLIDSLLFENRTVANGKFTGEEFKLVLKKLFPFIEVIVITQNGTDSEITKVAKYDKSCGKTIDEYYDSILPKLIDEAVSNIQQCRKLAVLVKQNDSWEVFLKEKILDALNGMNTYEELTKTDIDKLISAFKELQGDFND